MGGKGTSKPAADKPARGHVQRKCKSAGQVNSKVKSTPRALATGHGGTTRPPPAAHKTQGPSLCVKDGRRFFLITRSRMLFLGTRHLPLRSSFSTTNDNCNMNPITSRFFLNALSQHLTSTLPFDFNKGDGLGDNNTNNLIDVSATTGEDFTGLWACQESPADKQIPTKIYCRERIKKRRFL